MSLSSRGAQLGYVANYAMLTPGVAPNESRTQRVMKGAQLNDRGKVLFQ